MSLRRRRWRLPLALLVAALLALNGAAYLHARAMTRYAGTGARTPPPEALSWLGAARVLAGGVTVPRPRNGRTPADAGLAAETVTLPSGHGPTLEAWYVPAADPTAPLVIALPGYAAAKAALLPVAQALYGMGYATLLLDFHGAGGSSGSGTTLGVLEARDAAAALAWARARWPARPIVLYGFSMGGVAALRAVAVEGARPDALIVEATFAHLRDTVRRRFHSLGLPATPLAELLLFWGGVQWGFDPFDHDPADYARAADMPLLVLQGDADARVGADAALAIAAAGAQATLAIYPGVGHTLAARAAPDAWRRDVQALLARLAAD